MKIGIIGSGNIGSTAAKLFVAAGHDVALSNSRGPESLRELVQELGPHAHAMTVDEAARFGDVVLLAVPFRLPHAFPSPDAVRGKIVIDATNPYSENFEMIDLHGSTSSEEVAKRLPGARLVKAFNTIYYQHLAHNGRPGAAFENRDAIFLAGDDQDAKDVVARLISDIGFAPIETGGLRAGGLLQQPGAELYNTPMTAMSALAMLGRSNA